MENRGRNRALRLDDDWRRREMEEWSERFWANWARVWAGVEGFPQRTSTEDTRGEAEYVAASDWRRGIRDSE